LQNARLYSSERRRAAQLQAINNIVRRATAVLHMDELLDTVCEQVLQNFPIENVAIVLIEGGKLIYRRHRGTLRPYLQEGDVVPEGGLCTRALSTRDAVVEREVSKAPDYIAGCDGAEGEICLPLISFGEPLGVLVLDSARTDAFESQDVKALQAVADICATAIQNARHFERARSLANLDGLTGIYNRRYFEERVADEMLRAVRYKSTFSVVMLDIDSFKKLNDEFGHLLGDEVLRQFAQIFTQNLRKVDIACRYGGEEFAIVLPETDGAKAVKVAEKLRQITEQWRFPGVPRPVTISAGIAEFRRNGHTRDEVVGAADAALYAAKQQGRNRVIRAAAANAAAAHAND
jgi:diguanylate cyclase (GGDEF)-like protein